MTDLHQRLSDATEGEVMVHSSAEDGASIPIETEAACVANLRAHQQQLDADGCMVGVSRQALDETLAIYDGLLVAIRPLTPADDASAAHFAAMDPDETVNINLPVRCILRARAAILSAKASNTGVGG